MNNFLLSAFLLVISLLLIEGVIGLVEAHAQFKSLAELERQLRRDDNGE